jgi:glutamine amidotransferase
MCMLCLVPPNVIPSREKLENSALNNPHGFGFAIVISSENRIHAERTMNADTSINRFLELRAKYPEDYALWHARLATHGSTTVDNCHPFKVGGDERTYLAHNGILPILEPTGDMRSDTRIFAEDLLPAIGGVSALDNPQVMNLIEDFTSGSKVAILTVDTRAAYQAYLIHENKGHKDSTGTWWSNDSCHLPSSRTWYSVKPMDFGVNDTGDYCIVCDSAVETGDELDYCPTCSSCYSCYMAKGDCLCYHKKPLGVKPYPTEGGAWGW